MSIQYSGNAQTTTFTTGVSTPATDVETVLVAALVTASWTNNPVAASAIATFGVQPSNNDTITVGSGGAGQKVYTFKTSLAGCSANAILIDVSLSTTIDNLKQAVIAGPGSGTKYCAGTTAHTTITVSASDATTITFAYIVGGSAGNGAALASSSGNITFSSSTLTGGKNVLTTTQTPQGLQATVDIHTASGSFYNPGTTLSIIPGTWDNSITGHDCVNAAPGTSVNYRIIANKYQFMLFVPGSLASNTPGNGTGIGVPFITSNVVAPTITTATNASPISCNIPTHGYTTGQSVLIVSGQGNTAVNGQFVITVVDANNFTLNGSTGNGAYVGSTAYCSNLTIGATINEAIWATGTNGGAPATFRNSAYVSNGGWTIVNRQALSADNSSARLQIVVSGSLDNSVAANLQWYDNSFVMLEPFVAYGIATFAPSKIIGQIWDGVIVRTALSIDQTATFDTPAHNFWTIGVGNTSGIAANNNSVLLATS